MRFYTLFVPFILVGCSSVTNPMINEYTIYPSSLSSQQTEQHTSKILRLAPTRTIPSLETKYLSYLRSNGESGNYLYTRWSDTPSLLIERSLHHTLDEKALFSAILSPSSASNADVILESELHAFYHRFEAGKPSKGIIDITYRLIDTQTKLPIASKRFLITQESPSEDAIGGIKALSEATNELSHQCTQWIQESLKR